MRVDDVASNAFKLKKGGFKCGCNDVARIDFKLKKRGFICMSMTWRALSAGP
jgi:hypothetical protein